MPSRAGRPAELMAARVWTSIPQLVISCSETSNRVVAGPGELVRGGGLSFIRGCRWQPSGLAVGSLGPNVGSGRR